MIPMKSTGFRVFGPEKKKRLKTFDVQLVDRAGPYRIAPGRAVGIILRVIRCRL